MEYYYNNKTKMQLSEIVKGNPNGIILLGQKGLGKSHAAEYLAATLLKSDIKKLNVNPDFFRILSSEGKIKIDTVREAIKIMSYVSVGETKKVLLIDDADCMTEAAQNALLKILENGMIHIIFVAHKRLLSTITSRCQIINFLPLKEEEFPDKKVDKVLFALSKGNIGLYTKIQKESNFLEEVKKILHIIGTDENKRMLMEEFGCLKEKDKRHFLDTYGIQYAIYLFEFLQEEVFLPFLMKEFEHSTQLKFPVYGYSKEQILEIIEVINKHLIQMKLKQYNKNDFFILLKALVA